MARSINKWLEEVVNPDPVLGPIYRGEQKALGDIYTHYFFRNPKRPIIKEDNTFKAPADGVLVSNGIYNVNKDTYVLKGAEFDLPTIIGNNTSFNEYLKKNDIKYVQIYSIFMTFYSPHWNRVPIDSKCISRTHMKPIITTNMPMVEVEDQIIKDRVFKMSSIENYYNVNERLCSHYSIINGPKNFSYELVQVADTEVNKCLAFYNEGDIANQGDLFGLIMQGSTCDLILPCKEGVIIENLAEVGTVVEAGVDNLCKIHY